ncbi:MAG: PD-(D/E)XK nuclease-like domain-containing protein [Pseudomonadota bacterium]
MGTPEQIDEQRDARLVEPGWYPDMSNAEYHGSFAVGSSRLKTLCNQTPAHFHYERTHPKESTPAMALGTAVHAMVLEPDTYKDAVAVLPEGLNMRSSTDRAVRDQFIAMNAGKTIITLAQQHAAEYMAESVMKLTDVRILLSDMIPESSVFWWYKSKDPDESPEPFKQMLKVRPDALNPAHSIIIDLKTTRDATETSFNRAIIDHYYHLSAAMYLEGVNQCSQLLEHTGNFGFTKFLLVCVENTPPYPAAAYALPESYLDIGRALYRRAMRVLRDARDQDWPGFPDEIRTIEPPSWANRFHIV